MAISVDVVNDWVDYATALGTLGAVGIAVWDSTRANRRAARAEAETEELLHRQALERFNADAAAWADRSAIHVSAYGEIQGEVTDTSHAELRIVVENQSDHAIENVVVLIEPPHASGGRSFEGYSALARWDRIGAKLDQQRLPIIFVSPEADDPLTVRITTLFDDYLGNRWRLTPDRSLLLMRRRRLGMDNDPLDEASVARL